MRDDFAKLSCPILMLHGRKDWLVSITPMQKAVCNKGGARIVVFPAAHMLLQTCPVEAAMEIRAFVNSKTLWEAQNEN